MARKPGFKKAVKGPEMAPVSEPSPAVEEVTETKQAPAVASDKAPEAPKEKAFESKLSITIIGKSRVFLEGEKVTSEDLAPGRYDDLLNAGLIK